MMLYDILHRVIYIIFLCSNPMFKKVLYRVVLFVIRREVMFMSLVVRSQIKELVGELNVAGDFADALEKKVLQLVKDACARAEANGRKTIMAKDV